MERKKLIESSIDSMLIIDTTQGTTGRRRRIKNSITGRKKVVPNLVFKISLFGLVQLTISFLHTNDFNEVPPVYI